MVNIPLPKACIFDAFGTLFDLRFPSQQIDPFCHGKGQLLLDIWRRKQLEYTWLRSLMKQYVSFDQVTREALQFAMNQLDIKAPQLFDLLMPVYREARCFEDVPAMLAGLKAQGIPTAILSNGTSEMLGAGVRHAGIDHLIGRLLSVEEVEVFKPDPMVYRMASNYFDCAAGDLLFFSSNPWDIAGAGAFGLSTVWVNRTGAVPEVLPPPAAYVIGSMEELMERMVQ